MKNLQHPLEAAFNMAEQDMDIEKEYGMTEMQSEVAGTTYTPVEAPADPKDADDKLVEERIDKVYDVAMEAFNNQSAYLEVIDPKFAARNAEVAANYLNIALQAANSRAKVKTDRKRANQVFIPHGNNKKTTNNLVVADFNAVLKMINIDNTEKKV